jgi:DNA-binding MarR family transcriptional regulator
MFAILELGEGCLQKDIADNSYINKKTINSTIKKLERTELITLKAGKYPNMHIYLTQKGYDYIQKNIIPIIEVENKVLECFPDTEFDSLIKNYSKYIKVFRAEVQKFN